MKRVGLLFLITFGLLSLFNSCQKEEFKDPHVELIVYDPVMTGSSSWTVSGRILSSGKVDFSEYGFDVMINSSQARRYPLGETNKPGKVETILELLPNEHVTGIVLYAADKYGHFYTSKTIGDSITGIPVAAPPIIDPPLDSSNSSFDYFYTDIQNPNNIYYSITEYGLEYRLDGTSDPWLSYSYMTSYFPNTTVPVNMGLPKNLGLFTNSMTYEYRIYAMAYYLPNGTQSKVYSPSGTFTFLMP